MFVLGALLCIWTASGCSRAAVPDEGETAQSGDDEPESKGDSTASAKPKKKKKKVDLGPRLGDIPLDAFGNEPIASVAAGGGGEKPAPTQMASADPKPEVAKPEAGKPEAAKPEAGKPEAKPETAKGGAAGAHDWPTLLTGDTITEETKKIRLHLKDSLSNVAKYNESCKDIEVDGAVMAALATIMSGHPDSVTWKPKAKFVRDVAFNMGACAKKGQSKANFDPTQAEYEKLTGLLAGDSPAGVGEAAEKVPFHEVAMRGPLMRRMEKAKDYLSLTIKNLETLKKDKDAVVHEARILATLTKVVGNEGYASADEAEYQEFIKTIIQSSLDAATAGGSEDFDAFHGAIEKVKTACEQCHKDYRFGSN